jgi:hypothetical protein
MDVEKMADEAIPLEPAQAGEKRTKILRWELFTSKTKSKSYIKVGV